jgi:hypothetical protein
MRQKELQRDAVGPAHIGKPKPCAFPFLDGLRPSDRIPP